MVVGKRDVMSEVGMKWKGMYLSMFEKKRKATQGISLTMVEFTKNYIVGGGRILYFTMRIEIFGCQKLMGLMLKNNWKMLM
jgi:hypothetical protein